MNDPDPTPETGAAGSCPRCGKPAALCICDAVVPVANRVTLLVLQHPQEQDKLLGTARVAVSHLTDAVFRVGLSWPSLEKALGRPADPRRWAVLHLGSVEAETLPPGRDLWVLDRKGQPLADQEAALDGLEGVVLFDGSWSQAKTLWWRNPWVLKARRIVLAPGRPSLYGRLRKEPRREGLSTIEAAAMVLARIERRPEIETQLTSSFRRMLQRYRDSDFAKPKKGAGRSEA